MKLTALILLFCSVAGAQDYGAYGFSAEQERELREVVAVMQPTKYPALGIVMLPTSEFRIQKMQLARRGFMANNGSPMNIGRAFVIPGIQRIYIDAGLWDARRVFFRVLAHELGHIAATSTSEAEADNIAKPMINRLKEREQHEVGNR